MEADDKRSAGASALPEEPLEDQPIGEVAADEGLGGEGPTPSVLEDFGPTAVPPAEDVATGFEEIESHEHDGLDAAAADGGDAVRDADPARARRLRSVV